MKRAYYALLKLLLSKVFSYIKQNQRLFNIILIVLGEKVVAVGYPFFSERHYKDIKPTITKGTISKVSPFMIQTSCCVQSGFSGGCILRIRRLHNQNIICEVLGVIVCNVRNDEKKVSYPNLNIAIPVTAFKDSLNKFMETEGIVLKYLF